jgi:drug/metabolite transporter (DMT)-like permease
MSGKPFTPWMFVLFGGLVLIWGSTWLVIRIGLESFPPFFSLAVRFGLAGPAFFLLMKLRREKIPWGREHQPFFLAIAFLSFITSYGVVYWAEQYISSGLASVLFALMPLLSGVIAHFWIRERLGPARIAGLVLGLLGAVVINSSDLRQMHPKAPLAALLMLASPVVVALSTVMSKRKIDRYSSLAMAGLPMTYGAVFHFILFLLLERDAPLTWSLPGVLSILYLTFFGSLLTFWGYYFLLRRVEVARVNLLAYLTPIVAIVLGYLFAGEVMTLQMAAGSMLVLIGVGIASRPRRKLAPAVPGAAGR